jgi:hypothetical protein
MPLSMWTIYDRPPGLHFFTAVRFYFDERGTTAWPTDDIFVGTDLDELRKEMMGRGLTKLLPEPGAKPNIVEMWLPPDN